MRRVRTKQLLGAGRFILDFEPLEGSLSRTSRRGVYEMTPEQMIVELRLSPKKVREIKRRTGYSFYAWFTEAYRVMKRHGLLDPKNSSWESWLTRYREKRSTAEKTVDRFAASRARTLGDVVLPVIERASGPALTASAVARKLGCTRPAVLKMISRNELIAYRLLGTGTRFMLPAWQFRPRGRVCPWVSELVESYGGNGWALLNFVLAPRKRIGGQSYLHLLKCGNALEVMRAAKRSNPS